MSDLTGGNLRLPIITGRPTPAQQTPQRAKPAPANEGKSFRQMLDSSLQTQTAATTSTTVTFSRHAMERVALRGVELGPDSIERLESAVEKAGEKGITDSLVYLDDTAFIVNIPNRVVVTVVGSGDGEQTVITNINGAVIG